MSLSLEQKEELVRIIKKKETQLRRRNISVKSGELWYKAIKIILTGGSFQSVVHTLESYPQESLFVA